jgi:DNA-binding NarL/FixJ family response regulator
MPEKVSTNSQPIALDLLPGQDYDNFNMTIRVLLVDDHALVREGVAGLLATQPDIEIAGEAEDGFQALEKARATMPDVILMDIEMPRCDGLEATRLIKQELPYVKIVMLTVHDADDRLFEAVRNGAQGYLLKDIGSAELIEMLRGIEQGEAPISRTTAARILDEFARQDETRQLDGEVLLTRREREVLQWVARGASNREIAEALVISENTVKNHMRNILSKLHLSNRAQVMAYALRRGLVNNHEAPSD